MSEYTPGQEVWIDNVNRRGRSRSRGVVTKVGRTLVHVEGPLGRTETYEIETGVGNNAYRHSFILTDAESVERDERSAIGTRLSAHRVFDLQRIGLSTQALAQIADLIDTELSDE